jgi:hypothetical protein
MGSNWYVGLTISEFSLYESPRLIHHRNGQPRPGIVCKVSQLSCRDWTRKLSMSGYPNKRLANANQQFLIQTRGAIYRQRVRRDAARSSQ